MFMQRVSQLFRDVDVVLPLGQALGLRISAMVISDSGST